MYTIYIYIYIYMHTHAHTHTHRFFLRVSSPQREGRPRTEEVRFQRGRCNLRLSRIAVDDDSLSHTVAYCMLSRLFVSRQLGHTRTYFFPLQLLGAFMYSHFFSCEVFQLRAPLFADVFSHILQGALDPSIFIIYTYRYIYIYIYT